MTKTDTEKIIAILEKSDLPDAIASFHELKNWLTAKIIEHTNHLEEEQNKFLKIKDTISPISK